MQQPRAAAVTLKLVCFEVGEDLIDYNRCIDCVTFAPYMRIQFSDGSSLTARYTAEMDHRLIELHIDR